MEIKKLNEEISGIENLLAARTQLFNRSYSMVLATEIVDARKLLRQKKQKLNSLQTVGDN